MSEFPGSAPALPPISAAPMPTFPPAAQPRPAAPVVGRPLADPDAQEAKERRTAEQRRLEEIAPMRAKDAKLQVYQLRGGRVPPGSRPVATILASEIESEIGGGKEIDEIVIGRIPERFTTGFFRCQFFDKLNKPVNNPPPWDLELEDDGTGSPDDQGEQFNPDNDEEQIPTFPTSAVMPMAPPAPPALDLPSIAGAMRTERAEARNESSGFLQAIMAMNANSQQQQQAMLLSQQQLAAENRRAESEREERAAARRADFTKTLVALLAPIAPVLIEKFLGPKPPTESLADKLVLELVKDQREAARTKSTDMVMVEQLMKMQGDMMKSQIEMQGAGAAAAVNMQAEASGVVFKHLLGTMKEVMESKPKESEGGGMMETIAKFAGPLLASFAAQQQQQPQQALPTPEQTQQQAPVQQPRPRTAKPAPPSVPDPGAAAQPAEAPVTEAPPAENPAARPRRRRPQPADYAPEVRIKASLDSVRRMATGDVPVADHWKVVKWMSEMLPDNLLNAIKGQDRDQVMLLAMPAVLSIPALSEWIVTPQNAEFLEQTLNDVRLLTLVGSADKLTPDQHDGAIKRHQAYLDKFPPTGAAAPTMATPPPPPASAAPLTDATAAVQPENAEPVRLPPSTN